MSFLIPPDLIHLLHQQIRHAGEREERIYEPMVGLVVDIKDPDKLGRIKVSFPDIPGDDTSWWAPIASVGAGKDRGWFFLPELDDEVLVMFAHGDIQRPIVLGALWNGKDDPPDTNGGSNERRMICSREGSKIIFDDDAGTLSIEDGKGKGKITISTENKITIEAQGDICIQAPKGECNIVADDIKTEGKMNWHLDTGSQGANMQGKTVQFKGGMSLMVSGMTSNFNSGSANAAEAATDSCEEVADPVGGG